MGIETLPLLLGAVGLLVLLAKAPLLMVPLAALALLAVGGIDR